MHIDMHEEDEMVNRVGNDLVKATSAEGQQIKRSVEKVEMAWL